MKADDLAHLLKVALDVEHLLIGHEALLEHVDAGRQAALRAVRVLQCKRTVDAALRATPDVLERDLLEQPGCSALSGTADGGMDPGGAVRLAEQPMEAWTRGTQCA